MIFNSKVRRVVIPLLVVTFSSSGPVIAATEEPVDTETVTVHEAAEALALCQSSDPGLQETIAACKKAIAHPEFADNEDAHYFLGVNYIYANDEESAKKQLEEMLLLGMEGAPGLLIHAMIVMKPEWLTKSYVAEVNEFVEFELFDSPAELTVEEVRMVEEYYAPEIRYMYELLAEMPRHVFQTEAEYSYYAFDQEWADEKRAEVSEYRFYELLIKSPKGSDPLTPKVNRYKSSRTHEAEYSKENVVVDRGVYDGTLTFYAYTITHSVHGDEFWISAKFEVPE